MSKSMNDFADFANMVGRVADTAIKYDQMSDDRLLNKIRVMLSEDSLDFKEATSIFINIIIKNGDFSKVPIILIEIMFDIAMQLNELSLALEEKIKFPEINFTSLQVLKKRFDRRKLQWDKNAVLAIRAAEIGKSKSDQLMTAITLANRSDRDKKSEPTNGEIPAFLKGSVDTI